MTTRKVRFLLPAIVFVLGSVLASVANAAPSISPSLCFPQRLVSFSKDVCDGSIGDGQASIFTCADGAVTLCVQNATWLIPLRTNSQECKDCGGQPGRCDETGDRKSGTLKLQTNFTLRINEPCRFRGCWSGRWELQTLDGTIYQGTASGTFGAGTHRRFACDDADGVKIRDCEECYDVDFVGFTPDFGLWRVGVEGVFTGCAVSAVDPSPENICFSLSGDLIAAGSCDGGPFDPNSFRFYGAADGVLSQRCITIGTDPGGN